MLSPLHLIVSTPLVREALLRCNGPRVGNVRISSRSTKGPHTDESQSHARTKGAIAPHPPTWTEGMLSSDCNCPDPGEAPLASASFFSKHGWRVARSGSALFLEFVALRGRLSRLARDNVLREFPTSTTLFIFPVLVRPEFSCHRTIHDLGLQLLVQL